jgi:hypothetical protein
MQMASALAQKHGLDFAQVSARTGQNVNRALADFLGTLVRAQVEAVSLRDIYLGFLLETNADFDDDLLQDAIAILTDSY